MKLNKMIDHGENDSIWKIHEISKNRTGGFLFFIAFVIAIVVEICLKIFALYEPVLVTKFLFSTFKVPGIATLFINRMNDSMHQWSLQIILLY